MSPNLVIKFLPLLFILWAQARADDTIYPLITYNCDSGADIVVITNSLIKGGNGKTYNYSDADGTYSPWDLVEIEHTSDKSRIVKTSKITKTCQLSSGSYIFTIEPQLFGRDLNGRCGASISAAVTISLDDIEIFERTPFENFCHGNAPVITQLTTFGKTGEVKIKRIPRHKFY